MNVKGMNNYIKSQEPDLQIAKGRGYFYFLTKDGRFTPESIYTISADCISKEDLDYAIAEYKKLKENN